MFSQLQLGDSTLLIKETETGNVVMALRADSDVVVRAVASLARTDTAAKNLFILPPNAIPIRLQVYSATASNAATTATISVGKTGNNTFFLNGYDVKGNSGQLTPATVANWAATIGTTAIQVTGIYAETGTASTSGGPFIVLFEYYLA